MKVNFSDITAEKETIESILKDELIENGKREPENIALIIGEEVEIAKVVHRKKVLIFLCIIITFELVFVNYLIYLIATQVTHISEAIFKYFISGIFLNLFTLFKGITKYLYNDKSSSLLDVLSKNKSK